MPAHCSRACAILLGCSLGLQTRALKPPFSAAEASAGLPSLAPRPRGATLLSPAEPGRQPSDVPTVCVSQMSACSRQTTHARQSSKPRWFSPSPPNQAGSVCQEPNRFGFDRAAFPKKWRRKNRPRAGACAGVLARQMGSERPGGAAGWLRTLLARSGL